MHTTQIVERARIGTMSNIHIILYKSAWMWSQVRMWHCIGQLWNLFRMWNQSQNRTSDSAGTSYRAAVKSVWVCNWVRIEHLTRLWHRIAQLWNQLGCVIFQNRTSDSTATSYRAAMKSAWVWNQGQNWTSNKSVASLGQLWNQLGCEIKVRIKHLTRLEY